MNYFTSLQYFNIDKKNITMQRIQLQKVNANTEYFCSNVKSKMIIMSYVMRYIPITFITCQVLDETVKEMIKTR